MRLGYKPRFGDRLVHPGGTVFLVEKVDGAHITCSWKQSGTCTLNGDWTSNQSSIFEWRYLAPAGWRIERAT